MSDHEGNMCVFKNPGGQELPTRWQGPRCIDNAVYNRRISTVLADDHVFDHKVLVATIPSTSGMERLQPGFVLGFSASLVRPCQVDPVEWEKALNDRWRKVCKPDLPNVPDQWTQQTVDNIGSEVKAAVEITLRMTLKDVGLQPPIGISKGQVGIRGSNFAASCCGDSSSTRALQAKANKVGRHKHLAWMHAQGRGCTDEYRSLRAKIISMYGHHALEQNPVNLQKVFGRNVTTPGNLGLLTGGNVCSNLQNCVLPGSVTSHLPCWVAFGQNIFLLILWP